MMREKGVQEEKREMDEGNYRETEKEKERKGVRAIGLIGDAFSAIKQSNQRASLSPPKAMLKSLSISLINLHVGCG